MSWRRLPIVLVGLVFVGACGEATRPDAAGRDVRGRVIDARGRPVADAAVVLQYAVDPPVESQRDKPQTMIAFSLPVAGPVFGWIGSFCGADTMRVLVNGVLPPGQHTIVWDGKDDAQRDLPDGVYWFHLKTSDREDSMAMLMLRLGYQDFTPDAPPAPLAITDARGWFSLGQACLPFGFIFEAIDELGNPIATVTVTRSVRVWVFSADADAVAATGWLTVDPKTGLEVTVRLGQ